MLRLVDEFFSDADTYSTDDLLDRRRGLYKDIAEELYPLVMLAEFLDAEQVRLSAPDVQGPDGELRLPSDRLVTVQITCSHERGDRYLLRQALRESGRYFGDGRCTSEVVAERLERVLTSVRDKEQRHRAGTDILLIHEESISWGDVIDPELPNQLDAALRDLPPSRYDETYIIYGRDVRRLR
jgi:hypothetical protein